MIGVIVWSNAAREKAVVWCEDQGALAYLQGRHNLVGGDQWPTAGDMVELECDQRDGLRHAFNVSLILENGCPGLPEHLRTASGGKSARRGPPDLRLVSRNDAPRPAEGSASSVIAVAAG